MGVTRGQRDEGPHHRQQAPDEDGPPAVAIEPAPGPLDAGAAAEKPRPTVRGRLASVPAGRPGRIAADYIARHAARDDQRQVEVYPGHRARRYSSAEGHRELRGYWYAGRLCRHQQDYGQISVGANEMLHPCRLGQSSIGNRRLAASWACRYPRDPPPNDWCPSPEV